MQYEYVDKPLAYPGKYVVPLIGQPNGPFLGTAFFCRDSRTLLTARHCVANWNGEISFGDMSGYVVTPRTLRIRAVSQSLDIAMLDSLEFESEYFLSLGKPESIRFNVNVFTYEYGTTMSAGNCVNFNPATRMGNITRTVHLENLFQKTGDAMLELSFPALKGASGSPIIAHGHEVWGMIVANHSVELTPTQIEEIRNNEGMIEERVVFSMPQALAMHVKHLTAFMAENRFAESKPR